LQRNLPRGAIALGTALVNQGKKARFHNAVDLINALIKEQVEGNAGKIIRQLSALDCVIIDELGYRAPPVRVSNHPPDDLSLQRTGAHSPNPAARCCSISSASFMRKPAS